jgi:hypothetical protein
VDGRNYAAGRGAKRDQKSGCDGDAMSNVVNLELIEAGEHYRVEAEKVLVAAGAVDFERMVVIGRTSDGGLYVAGTANAGESMILIEQARHYLAFGKDAAT